MTEKAEEAENPYILALNTLRVAAMGIPVVVAVVTLTTMIPISKSYHATATIVQEFPMHGHLT